MIDRDPELVDFRVELEKADGAARFELGEPDKLRLFVRSESRRMLGPFRFETKLHTIGPLGIDLGPFVIPVTGEIQGDIDWSPKELHLFGDQELRETVQFTSRSGSEFESVEIVETPDFLETELKQDTKTPNLSIRQKTGPSGLVRGVILVKASTKDKPGPLIMPIGVSSHRTNGKKE